MVPRMSTNSIAGHLWTRDLGARGLPPSRPAPAPPLGVETVERDGQATGKFPVAGDTAGVARRVREIRELVARKPGQGRGSFAAERAEVVHLHRAHQVGADHSSRPACDRDGRSAPAAQ